MNYFRRQIAAVSFIAAAGLVVMAFTLAGCDKIVRQDDQGFLGNQAWGEKAVRGHGVSFAPHGGDLADVHGIGVLHPS